MCTVRVVVVGGCRTYRLGLAVGRVDGFVVDGEILLEAGVLAVLEGTLQSEVFQSA
jgi:hypothetical protein